MVAGIVQVTARLYRYLRRLQDGAEHDEMNDCAKTHKSYHIYIAVRNGARKYFPSWAVSAHLAGHQALFGLNRTAMLARGDEAEAGNQPNPPSRQHQVWDAHDHSGKHTNGAAGNKCF